jgi:hypothetical protein
MLRLVAILGVLTAAAFGQRIEVVHTSSEYMPVQADSNSPALWVNGEFTLFNSVGIVMVRRSTNQFLPYETEQASLDGMNHLPVWMEAAWQDDDGTIYAWYHHEPEGIRHGESLTAPEIGAMISHDGGNSFSDLGIVLRSGDAPNCSAKNGFFAGGHGDFSVILDRDRKYFYFLFSNYGGDGEEQGIATARMALEDRRDPVGKVAKYFEGEWNEPGIGGHVTPFIGVKRGWQFENADAFWGPSVHWNTHLEAYVILLNHACCAAMWPQDGIYASFTADLEHPERWTEPKAILEEVGYGPGFYPQVLGLEEGGTDSEAGHSARLYVQGISKWELIFHRPGE